MRRKKALKRVKGNTNAYGRKADYSNHDCATCKINKEKVPASYWHLNIYYCQECWDIEKELVKEPIISVLGYQEEQNV